MLIAFHTPTLCVRGTNVAVYDYAHYNEIILGNKSLIIIPENNVKISDSLAVAKFIKRFDLITYPSIDKLDETLEKHKVDLLYCIKYGKNDGIFSSKIKTVIHCVFDMSEPHGNVYAGVSKEVALKFGNTTFVPHMVSIKPFTEVERNSLNLRKKLSIPEDALVFGRYGGEDTFNLLFVWEAIHEIVTMCNNIYFIFINTPQLVKHPNVKYLDKITSDFDKNSFIATCDAHLEAGTMGHSFGLSIAENSVNNVPIIAYKSPNLLNNAHIEILKDKAFYFSNKEEFKKLIITFDKNLRLHTNFNCYEEYTPEKIMLIFKEKFIDSI